MTELLLVASVAALVFVLAALAQAVSGFGSALVAVPLLTLVVGPATAVVATTMVSLLLAAGAWRRERAYVDRSLARTLTVAGLLGMPLGLVALARLDDRSLTAMVAVGLFVAVALLWRNVPLPAGRSSVWAAGVASGALLTSTGMNGPPVVLSLHALALPARRFRATLQAVFCSQDALAVTAFVATGHLHPTTWATFVGGATGLPLGWWVGNRIFHGLPAERFRSIVLGGLVVTALVALGNAVLSG